MSFGMEYGGGMGGGYGGFGGGGGFSGFEGMGGDDLTGGGGFLDGTAGKSAEKKNRDNQSITSVSIKQLNTAESDDGEMFRVDGMQLYQVKIIGFIESMATHSTSQMYMINDGSGVIECKAFIEKNEGGGSSAPMESMLCENVHVKVFGSMRQYENKRHVLIYKITPLTDFNEMTHHMLETVLVHLQNTQGPIPGSAAAMVGATPHRGSSNPMSITPSGGPMGGGYATGNLNSLMQRGAMNDGLIDLLFDVIRTMPSPDNAGTHILDIMSALNKRKNNTPLIEVKKTLTILLEQGNLYTGADDDRYCAIE